MKMPVFPAVAVTAAVLAATGTAAGTRHVTASAKVETYKLTAMLDAKQEVPAQAFKAPNGHGTFTATLKRNGSQGTITWRLAFSGLSGAATAAHIHAGRSGVAGPVAVALCGPCMPGDHGTVKVSGKVLSEILSGGTYVNVHTAKNPSGEIRGQLEATRENQPGAAGGY